MTLEPRGDEVGVGWVAPPQEVLVSGTRASTNFLLLRGGTSPGRTSRLQVLRPLEVAEPVSGWGQLSQPRFPPTSGKAALASPRTCLLAFPSRAPHPRTCSLVPLLFSSCVYYLSILSDPSGPRGVLATGLGPGQGVKQGWTHAVTPLEVLRVLRAFFSAAWAGPVRQFFWM